MDDQTKASAIVPSGLPNLRDPQSVRVALTDRLSLSEAISVVGQMLRGYPNGQQVPDSYIGALAEVLAQYPRCVASYAGDFVRGVPRETRFLPTPADLIVWLEREVAHLRQIVQRDDEHQALIRQQQARAEQAEKAEAARAARPTYDDLKAKYGPNWGIGQPTDEAATHAKAQLAARMAAANRTMLLREYAGAEPVEAAPGIPVSVTLRRMLAERAESE